MGVVIQPSDRRLGQIVAGSANGVTTQQQQQNSVISAPTGVVVNGIVEQSGTILNTPAGTPGPSWPRLFNPATTNEDPGSGYFSFDSSTYSDVTQIYIDNTNYGGGNVGMQLASIPTGVTFVVVFGSNVATFTVDSVSSNSAYTTLGVSFVSFSGPGEFVTGLECLLQITAGLTRYGMQFFDEYGILRATFDQFGFHTFINSSLSAAGPAIYNGELLPPSSAWVALELASGVSYASGAPVPSARLEPQSTVRLKGQLLNSSGGTISGGTTIATVTGGIESGFLPYWDLQFPVVVPSEASVLNLNYSGALSLDGSWLNNELVCLDGITFTTS